MKPIHLLSNAELDALGDDQDAREGQRVLKAVEEYLRRFVAYPSSAAIVAHVLWIVHAHLMDKWESTPRICFLSPEPGSGKTRALEITEVLVPNPVCAVNVSPAYLFRKVGDEQGVTILFDEIDTVFGPRAKENEEIRGLLNAGHRRGAVAGRCVVKGKVVTTEEIPAYSAVAIAGLGFVPDTIRSRSILIGMRRRHAGEVVEPYRRRVHGPQGEAIREKIAVWAASVDTINNWPDMPADIQDRDADVWEALLAVADLAGGDWPGRARNAAVTLVTAAKEGEPGLGVRLLADIKVTFGSEDRMATKDILAKLHSIEEAPWGDLKGKPLDERGLAQRLKQYSIKSKVIRFKAGLARGYESVDLHDAWARYLPPSHANSVTTETPVTDAGLDPAATHVSHVTHLSGQRGEARHQCVQCGEYGGTNEVFVGGEGVHLHPGHCTDVALRTI